MIPYAIAGIKELASTTLALQNQINALIATSTLTAKQGTIDLATLNSDLNLNGFAILNVKSISGLNGLWKIDEGGNITAQSVQTQALTVGGGAASGVTIYDRETAAPKCIYIEGGVIKTSDGACGATQNTGTPADLTNLETPFPSSATTTTATTSDVVATSTEPHLETEFPSTLTATSTEPILTESEPIIATSTEPVIVSTTTPETATTTP